MDQGWRGQRWLSEAKTLDDLKQIHDIAKAAEEYAKAQYLGLNAENHAREIRLVAGFRMAGLKPGESQKEKGSHGKEGGRGKKKHSSHKEVRFISDKKMAEFRKLYKAMNENESELRKRCKKINENEEKISVNRLLRGDWYQMSETPEWEIPP